MDKFSDEQILKNCPHCDPQSFGLKHLLKETANFRIVCDVHPLTEGHILIIPKLHISCVGAYSEKLYQEFLNLYLYVSKFIGNQYGSVSSFEHGNTAQTVFHSHVHLFPFVGPKEMVIPEGKKYLTAIKSLSELKIIFNNSNKFLFFSIGDNKWVVDTSLSAPRFFRDRFAKALGCPERGNWKIMHKNKTLMQQATGEINKLQKKWKKVLI